MLSFNKIVKKLWKKWWKILLKKDLFEIIDPEKKDKFKSYLDKTIYKLKSQKIIIPIKSGVYIIPDKDDLELNQIDLLDKYYLRLLKKYISFNVWSDYYISWKKALEIHMKDFSIPEKIYIVNSKLNKKIKVWSYEIIFKTISWKTEWKTINLYSKVSKFVTKKEIEWIKFKTSCLELSLVESALISDTFEWLDFSLVNKAIKKYSKIFDKEVFKEIWKFKYIMAFNRLKEISRNIDHKLYRLFLDIIKNNWWLFIGEWLRGF